MITKSNRKSGIFKNTVIKKFFRLTYAKLSSAKKNLSIHLYPNKKLFTHNKNNSICLLSLLQFTK
jgi:hypothetical protein